IAIAKNPSLLLSRGFRLTTPHCRTSSTIWYNHHPTSGCGLRVAFPGSPNSTGILAQEKFRGESLLFMRKEAELRQCPEPLFKGDASSLEPEPPEGSCPGRPDAQAGMGVRLLPQGVQGGESPEEACHAAPGRGR